MSIGPGDGDGCPYRIPYFLFCVLDMMIMFLGWYGIYFLDVGMRADVLCTARYAFDDLIYNIVATQQQMWVV